MSKTIHWSPGEASLGRASRNSYLEGAQKQFLDVTEEMMKAATIGRSSEMGPDWEPPGMVSRKIALVLTTGGRRTDDNSQQVTERLRAMKSNIKVPQEAAVARPPCPEEPRKAVRVASTPSLSRDISWGAMLPRRGASLATAGASLAALPQQAQLARVNWGPEEPSLARDSFNAMTKNQKCDVTEVMMREAMMGKAAMMGPGWDPPGLVSRKIAEVLSKR
ncbi:unnamed protein product [Effrenium voratum]|uniref:Uncharacterized protein n=2 Tax=Effrenium voratum TaxID=2562239 RepID=A0AA36IFY0_9DINO|nr:unnamed protein product [Effrenium voratum]